MKLALSAFAIVVLLGAVAGAFVIVPRLTGEGSAPAATEAPDALAASADAEPQSETAQPETAQPETAQPETAQSETAQPETAQPETAEVAGSEGVAPGAAQPEVAAADEVALMLRTDPAGATVRHDGRDLGDAPVPLSIPRGERWTLELSKGGYETRRVTVVGGQPELTVHLEPVRARRTRPVRRSARRRSRHDATRERVLRSPDLTDPWAQ